MSHVYQIIEYELSPCFASFADTVSDARREGDVHPDKAIIAIVHIENVQHKNLNIKMLFFAMLKPRVGE